MTLWVLGITFVLFILMGMPIAFTIAASSILAIIVSGESLFVVSHYMYSGINSFQLVAIPMFVLAGDIMFYSGMTRSLTNFADLFVGKFRGGLGHTNILGSVFFSGITGSATADITALGSILIPAMGEKGYGRVYATAVTVASSIIGPIIPPSLTFIIYALAVGNVSIGGLFLAGVIPGILTAVALMIMNYIISKKRNYPRREESYSRKEVSSIVKNSAVVLVMPIIIFVGVTTGIYTATESAAVATAYAFIVSILWRTLPFKRLPEILFNSAKVSSIMFVLLAASSLFSYVLTSQGIPSIIAEFLVGLTDNPLLFLLIVNIVLLLVGLVMDLYPAILIFAPILAPIAHQYGIDPIHFGIIFCVNLILGMNTPPVGSGLFIGASVGKIKVEALIKEIIPFLIVELIVLMLITYVPVLTTGLPTYFGY